MNTRTGLKLTPNPKRGEAYLVTLNAPLTSANLKGEGTLKLTYIPDRDIIIPENFSQWLLTLCQGTWQNWEHLSGEVIDLFYDELLPHRLEAHINIAGAHAQQLNFTKQQPGYKLPDTLTPRLG